MKKRVIMALYLIKNGNKFDFAVASPFFILEKYIGIRVHI